jgi:hypothetical protein
MEDEQALDPSLPKGHKLSKVRTVVNKAKFSKVKALVFTVTPLSC